MFSKGSLVSLIVITLLASSIVVALSNSDEISILFSSWFEGRPRMLVKLEILLPQVDADRCAVIVKRFPTMYNPTEAGFLYVGSHPPGTLVEVKNTLFAYVARYEQDPRTNELVIGYYEPQEYTVFVGCVRNNATIFKWVKIVEVFPRSIIHTERVRVEEDSGESGPSLSEIPLQYSVNNPFSCNISIIDSKPNHKIGECQTWVKGPMIYSISGLNVSFVMHSSPARSAVYLEAFADLHVCTTPNCVSEGQVQWESAGKKITPTFVTGETMGLSGYFKDRIYFATLYRYEWSHVCITGCCCLVIWQLYPAGIFGFARTGQESSLPYERCPYIPPTPPHYKWSGPIGEYDIWFDLWGTNETDMPLSSVSIGFTLGGVWSVSLNVDFYKAVRSDNQYTTPSIKIRATREYWWWYKDNDPRNHEILVAPG